MSLREDFKEQIDNYAGGRKFQKPSSFAGAVLYVASNSRVLFLNGDLDELRDYKPTRVPAPILDSAPSQNPPSTRDTTQASQSAASQPSSSRRTSPPSQQMPRTQAQTTTSTSGTFGVRFAPSPPSPDPVRRTTSNREVAAPSGAERARRTTSAREDQATNSREATASSNTGGVRRTTSSREEDRHRTSSARTHGHRTPHVEQPLSELATQGESRSFTRYSLLIISFPVIRLALVEEHPEVPVLMHSRGWNGGVIRPLYTHRELPRQALPSLGSVVDEYVTTHGYLDDIIVDLWQAVRDSNLTSNPWETFKQKVTFQGMSISVAHFIWMNVRIEDVHRVYLREDYLPAELIY